MQLITPMLTKIGKKTIDFLRWLEDGRKSHDLEQYRGEEMIRIDANGGSGKKIYIDERLMHKVDEYTNEIKNLNNEIS